jgi:hypothetical protein
MGFIRKLGTFAFLIALTFQSALAGNEHEHLQYLPTLDDIEVAMNGKLGQIPAQDLFSNPSILEKKFVHLVPAKKLEILVKNSDLSTLCANLSKEIPGSTPRSILIDLFEMGEHSLHNMESYLSSTNIRDILFRKDPEILIKAVQNHVKNAAFYEGNKTLFTIPNYLAKKKYLYQIKEIYDLKSWEVDFFYSIPRTSLFKDEKFDKELREGLELIESKAIKGLDVSSSIREGTHGNGLSESHKSKLEKNIKKIFKVHRQNNAAIRIHAFEAANSGQFYDILWKSLEECKSNGCLPNTIHIGHINALDDASLDRFQKLRKWKPNLEIVFEANIESNIKTHQADIQDLAKKIEKIHRKGFKVALGSDGRGILGPASKSIETLGALRDAGLKRSSMRMLIDESLIPLDNDPRSLRASDVLMKEREKIRSIVLKEQGIMTWDHCKMEFIDRLKFLFKR